MNKAIEDGRLSIQSKCKGALSTFHWDEKNPSRIELPSFCRSLIDALNEHTSSCNDCPALAQITTVHDDLQNNWEPKVQAWSFHWWLVNMRRQLFHEARANPLPRTTYLCFDFKDYIPALSFPCKIVVSII